MPEGLTFEILKQTDKDLVQKVSQTISQMGLKCRLFSIFPVIGVEIKVNDTDLFSNSEANLIFDQNSELAQQLKFQIYVEGDQAYFIVTIKRVPKQVADSVTVNFSTLPETFKDVASKFYAGLRNNLYAIDTNKYQERQAGEALKGHLEASEERLRRLEGIASSLIVDQERYRQKLEADFDARKEKYDQNFKLRESEFEEQEKALAERLKKIDDRESRHVRRDIANSIKRTFQDRAKIFTLSKGTVRLRSSVHIITIPLLIILGSAFFYSIAGSMKLFGIVLETGPEMVIRQILLGASFASTVVFYLRWLNRWFERHAQEEFLFKRQEVDIDRASWIVELASEWSDRGNSIPDNLMAKLTNNLFTIDSKEPDPIHPAEQIATALFGASAKASIKLPNGVGEVELDRKSLKDLNRTFDH